MTESRCASASTSSDPTPNSLARSSNWRSPRIPRPNGLMELRGRGEDPAELRKSQWEVLTDEATVS
jgi:hypothetical protein